MPTITQQSPAKINLFLHITGKRPDGYHNLQTVFRLIDLCDTLTFSHTDKTIGDNLPVTLTNAEHVTDNPADNLIIKAAIALLAFAKNHQILSDSQIAQLPIVDIHLDKHIPMGAGLGGGSSNCATALMTLNTLWQLGLSNEQLRLIGAKLGADVPIFIFGKDAIAEGIGEILTPIDLPAQQFLLLKPDAHISTAELFAHPLLKRDCASLSHDYLQSHCHAFTNQLTDGFTNVFEPVVCALSADVNAAMNVLMTLAATTRTTPRMTGSGSCVLLPVPSDFDKNSIKHGLQSSPFQAYWMHTL